MCLSVHDFLSAVREMGPDKGPLVHLAGTSERALEVAKIEQLHRYCAPKHWLQRGGFE